MTLKPEEVPFNSKKLTALLVLVLLTSSGFSVMFGDAEPSKAKVKEENTQEKSLDRNPKKGISASSADNLNEIVIGDGFENNDHTNHSWTFWDSQPTSGRDYWGISGKRKHNGSKSLYVAQNNDTSGQVYDNNMRADATVNQSMNIFFNESTLTYWIWYEMDTSGTPDWLTVEASRLGGVPGSWKILKNYTGSSGGWTQESIEIPMRFSSPRFKIRFRFNSHALFNDAEGVYLDDVKLTINSNRTGGNSTPLHSAGANEGPGFYGPSGITQRSNGNIFFTCNRYFTNAIGKYNKTNSSFEFYRVPTKGSLPTSITSDSKGGLWFTEFGGNKIGYLNTTTENFTQFDLNASSKPFDIAYNDGYVWFSEWMSGKLGRLDPQTGDLKEWILPRRWGKPPLPRGIEFGPAGDLWITESGCNQIVKFDVGSHDFVEHPIPTIINTKPVDLSFAENGKLHISESRVSRVGYFDISTGMDSYEEIEFNYTWRTSHLMSNKDNIWATHIEGETISRYNTTTSSLQNWSVPTPKSQPEGIFLSNSGDVLFTEWWDDNITKFDKETETFDSWSLPKIYVKDMTRRKFPAGKNVNYTSFVLSKNTTQVRVDYTLPNGTSYNESMEKPTWFSIYNSSFKVPNQEGVVQYTVWAKDNESNTFSVSGEAGIIPEPVARLGPDRTFDENHIEVLDGTDSFCPNRSKIVQYRWDFGDESENVTFGPPVITHNYSTSGYYTATLTIRDIYNRKDTDSVNFTVQPGEGTKVLLLDHLKDMGPIAARRLSDRTPAMLNDSMEKDFWSGINSTSKFDIIRRPPIYTEPTLEGGEYNISDYIQDFSPKMIVLSDSFLNNSDRWSLNMSERLTLMDYVEEGNGLMVTGGSLYDLREKTPESCSYVGPWGHTERLHISNTSSLNDILKYYRSSITANIGLGLFPLYEEVKHHVGKAFEEMYESAPDPVEKALYFGASTVAYSVPLLPANIPFKANFDQVEDHPDITDDLGDNFSLNLTNRYSKGGNHSLGNITEGENLTSAGWQLEYPFLMAYNALNNTRNRVQSLDNITDTMVENLTSSIDSFNGFFDFNHTNYSVGNLSLEDRPTNISEEDLRNITENITSSLLQALQNMYNARTNRPSEIEININFTVGNRSVNRTITIPLPVPLQKLFRPAKIATTSEKGLASVLKYEMKGQRYSFEEGTPSNYTGFDPINETPVSYRSTYFTFKPSLGGDNCTRLVENALTWLENTSEPEYYDLIGSMEVPEGLVNETRKNISESDLKGATNRSLLLKPKQNYTLSFSVNGSAQINVYWWGANKTNVTMKKEGSTAKAQSTRFENGSFYAATFKVNQTGNWTLTARVDADGLKTPLMAQKVPKQESQDNTDPNIDISSPSEKANLSSSSVTVEWNGSDNGSGINHYEVQLDSGGWTDVGTNNSHTFPGLSDGGHTVDVKAVDNASNINLDTVNFTVDTTSPTADAGTDQTVAIGEQFTLNGSGSSDNVGIVNYTWIYNETEYYGEEITHSFSELGTYTITLNVTDEAGNYDTDTVTITVEDQTAPTADAGEDRTVDEDTPVTFNGSGSTDNVGITDYTWTIEGSEYSGMEVQYTFNEPGNYTVTLNVSDGTGNYDTDTVNITVQDVTDPTAEAGADQTVGMGEQFTLNASGSSDNVDVVNYTWIYNGTEYYGEEITHSFSELGTYQFMLNVSDAAGNYDTDTVTITVKDQTAPTADVGEDRTVDEDTSVTFNGSDSSDNVGITEYTWTIEGSQYSGVEVQHTFTEPGDYTVILNVSDAAGNYDTDRVNITVQDVTDPTADAGADQTVSIGEQFILNASGSSDNVGIVNYTWIYNETEHYGEEITLSFSELGTYNITLNVTDAAGNYDTDTVTITVEDQTPPTAVATANQTTVNPGEDIQFDGSNSSDNVKITTYSWEYGDGSTGSGETATHSYGSAGNYTVTLTVSDAAGNTDTDTLDITVEQEQEEDTEPPVADAGDDQTVKVGENFTLDGSGSSDNVGIENYTWTIKGEEYHAEQLTHSFTSEGNYTITLQVSDAAGNYDTDTVTITVQDQTPPTAVATANQTTVNVGDPIQFDASDSSDNVEIINYFWDFGDVSMGSNKTTTHSYIEAGNYTVTLTVRDAAGNSDTDTINITVEEEAQDTEAPVADAGADKTVNVGENFTLDASASSDNMEIENYTWTIKGEEYHREQLTHTFSSKGNYTVTLTVEDGAGNTDTDTVNITVEKQQVTDGGDETGGEGGTEPGEEGTSWMMYLIPIILIIVVIAGVLYWKSRGTESPEEETGDEPWKDDWEDEEVDEEEETTESETEDTEEDLDEGSEDDEIDLDLEENSEEEE